MKIGIDARMYSPAFTGIGRYVKELTDNLFRLDTENEYVLFLNKEQYDSFTPPNDRVKKVCSEAGYYSLKEQTIFLKEIMKEKLDLMHFTHFNSPILYPKKSIVTIHDLTLSKFPGKKMTKWYHRLGYHATVRAALSKATHIIAVSQNTKKDIVELKGSPEEKISVIYESVGEEFTVLSETTVQAHLEKYNLQPEQYFLYTGVWRDHKNVVGMIHAFAEIVKNNPGYKLVMTGKEDPYYPEVLEAIAHHKLEDSIILPGIVPEEDLIALYNGALCYVFPSFYEGFGLPPLEAMRCHTPVIASNTSCIPEITGADNALYFDPHNTIEIANRMQQIIDEPETRKKLIKNGIYHVQTFSWEKMAQETLDIYKKISTRK
ncbi:MAG: glycosyltransferase family 1 protein [Patescibacteria group bacterium]|nr:glycosyltransferase family 1 protein [Patescibacteria group bacterium]